MSERPDPVYSPGAAAEVLGTTVERARAALEALHLTDERGRPRVWYSAADVEAAGRLLAGQEGPPGLAGLPGGDSPPGAPPLPDDTPGQPEPVSAEDAEAHQAELARRSTPRKRRGAP